MIEQYPYNADGRVGMNDNVKDYYKGWLAEQVRLDLDQQRTGCVAICLNTSHDFNKSSIIRAANAFGVRKTYLVGRRRYDKRGTVGAQHFCRIFHADTYQEVYDRLKGEGYHFVALENNIGFKTTNISDIRVPYKTAYVFGEEGPGIPEDILNTVDCIAEIGMRGSTRSLNVAQAAAIAFYYYNWVQGY